MDRLMKILKDIKPDVDFETVDDMVEEGFLNSFDIVSIVTRINEEFGLDITLAELEPEQFMTPGTIFALIESAQKK